MVFTEEKLDEWRDGRRKISLWLVTFAGEASFYELRPAVIDGEVMPTLARRIAQLRAEVECKG